MPIGIITAGLLILFMTPTAPSLADSRSPKALKVVADSLQETGKFDEALATYDRALEAAAAGSEIAARIMLNRGWVLSALGRQKEAIASFDRAAELASSLAIQGLEGRALLAPLDFSRAIADPVDALLRSRDSVALARRAADPVLEAWAQVSLGQSWLEIGAPAAALEPISIARDLTLEQGNFQAAVDASTLLASAHLELQETDLAREVIGVASQLVEQHGLEHRRPVISQLLAVIRKIESLDVSSSALKGANGEHPKPPRFERDRSTLDVSDVGLEQIDGEIEALIQGIEFGLDQFEQSQAGWRSAETGDIAEARELERKRFESLKKRINELESSDRFLADAASWRQLAASSLQLLFSFSVSLGDLDTARLDHKALATMLGNSRVSVKIQQAILDLFLGSTAQARQGLVESLRLLDRRGEQDLFPEEQRLRPVALSYLAVVHVLQDEIAAAVARFRQARQAVGPALEPEQCARGEYLELGQLELEILSNQEAALAMALSSARQHPEALRRSLCAVRLATAVLDAQSRSTPLESLARAHLMAGMDAVGGKRGTHLRAADALFQGAAEQYRHIRRRQPREDQLRQLDIHSIPDEPWQKALVAAGRPMAALEVSEASRAPELLAGELAESTLERARQLAREQNVTFVVYSLIHDFMPAVLPGRFSGFQRHLEQHLYIWVISPRAADFRAVDLDALAAEGGLAYAVENSADEINGRSGGTVLFDHLIAPIADLLPAPGAKAVPRLVMIPHGLLHQVPFAALQGADGQALIESFEILLAPSVTSFGALSARSDSSREAILVVGDPTEGVLEQPDLPGARGEALRVSRALGVRPLLSVEASPEAVSRRLKSARLFHFAGHAKSDRLVLHGKDATGAALAIEQILQLDLDLDVAVLSACLTAAGKPSSAGILGVARAFLAAGTRTVVANLWLTDDIVTEEFMERFYHHIGNSKDVVTAHRLATLELLRRGAAAHEWAGVVVIGAATKPLLPKAS